MNVIKYDIITDTVSEYIGDAPIESDHIDSASNYLMIINRLDSVQMAHGRIVAWQLYASRDNPLYMKIFRPHPDAVNNRFRYK